MSNQW